MADVWDGPTQTKGALTYAYNTDRSAIRFSRTDNVPLPAELGKVLIRDVVAALLSVADTLELAASRLDEVDGTFAAMCRTRAGQYRTAAGVV
jgi:hypothetical protein